jgi:hypothetical protein
LIKAYEFKWNPKAKTKIPQKFIETYQAKVEVVNKENFRKFANYD